MENKMKNILLLLLFFVSSNLSGQNYKVDKSRIETNFYNLKKFGNNANEGNDRVAYSNFDIQARIYLKDKLKSLGAKVHTDFAGNVIAFYEGNKQNLKPISFGSHIDAVPNGGHYDGQAGVIASIEVLETIISKNIKLDHPLEMIIFSNVFIYNRKSFIRWMSPSIKGAPFQNVFRFKNITYCG